MGTGADVFVPSSGGGGGGGGVFTAYFASAQQTITSNGTLVLAHGLGAMPKAGELTLVCQTAEFGYSIGDVVRVPAGYHSGNAGVSVVPDATNINVRYGSSATSFVGMSKANGTSAGFTNANWKAVFHAWV